jgi:hypothetical protein
LQGKVSSTPLNFSCVHAEAWRLATKEFRSNITAIKIRIEIGCLNFLSNLFHLEGKGVKLINFVAESLSWNGSSCPASKERSGPSVLGIDGSWL